MDSVGLRVQGLAMAEQVLVLAVLAAGRSETGEYTAKHVTDLFDDLSLPGPSRIYNVLRALEASGYVRRAKGRGLWKITPRGRTEAAGLIEGIDLAVLAAEASAHGTDLGSTPHPVIPPSLAPPALIEPLRKFLEEHPFDRNVMGMTRFPDTSPADPVAPALKIARDGVREASAGVRPRF